MSTAVAEKNPLELPDEEFMNMVGPPAVADEPAPAATPEVQAEAAADAPVATPEATVQTPEEKPAESAADTAAAVPAGESTEAAGDPPAAIEGAEAAPKVDTPAAPNYEEFYSKIMTPFKANGKMIELRSPEEALQLMQQGANYTRKMQDFAPHRKVLTMLQNNGLLDESKLSYLIDLDKKDPEAIKKLIKDSGIDPLDIDTSVEPAYLEGSHRVTDEEVQFQAVLEDLGSTPEGKETLQEIHTRWDQSSKELLWKHPETFAIIHQQREAGIYPRIAAEVDRRTTLGIIPAGTPFLDAYKIVGDELTAADGFADLREKKPDTAPKDPPAGPTPEPVATRVAAPKAEVVNDEAASAASSTRAAPRKASEFINPLAMSDDEFLKHFEGRL